jgi:ribosomal protein S18 acetylase RimI-like enzyme
MEYERDLYDPNIIKELHIQGYFEKRINKKHQIVLVAKDKNISVGYVYAIVDYDNKIKIELEGSIDSIFVKDEYRKKGIGTELINKALEELKKCGVKHFFITNIAANAGAARLYDRFGFKVFRETRKLQ